MNDMIKKSGVFISIIASLAVTLGIFLYWADSVRSDLQNSIEFSAHGDEVQKHVKIQAMRKELRDTLLIRKELLKLTIEESEVPELLNNFESLGYKDNSLLVRSVDIDASVKILRVALSISGSFAEIMNTINQINESNYALHIESFEMRKGKKKGPRKESWDASIRVILPLSKQSSDKNNS